MQTTSEELVSNSYKHMVVRSQLPITCIIYQTLSTKFTSSTFDLHASSVIGTHQASLITVR